MAVSIGKSRSAVNSKRSLYKGHKTAAIPAAKAAPAETTEKKFGKSSVRHIPTSKQPKVVRITAQLKKTRKALNTPVRKLRPSLVPGTVVILLSGRFAGKKAVFVKQLLSGLMLVTGPFKMNGVPMKRVDAAYVVATSIKLDISSVKIDDKLTDKYFAKTSSAKKSAEEEFFDASKAVPNVISTERIADQKAVDKAISPIVKAMPNLEKYMKATFGLSKGDYPHNLKF